MPVLTDKIMREGHDRLSNLALDAVVTYVGDLCLRLLQLPQGREEDRITRNSALETCKRLQVMLHPAIPHIFANEATAKLLKCIDNLSTKIRQWSKEPWTEEIMQELINAVIHPSVTIIELSKEPQHIFPFGLKWNFLVPLVYSRLHTLKKLKIIRLARPRCENWITGKLIVSERLEEFTFIHMADDKMLIQLVESCRFLKRLNVSDSSKVTDMSIPTILNFRHLEELNLVGTGLTEAGLTRLLKCLSEGIIDDAVLFKELSGCDDELPLSDLALKHSKESYGWFMEGYFSLDPYKKMKMDEETEQNNIHYTDKKVDILSYYGNAFQRTKTIKRHSSETRKTTFNHSKQLKSFGCSYITYPQLTLLANNFPNLIELHLSHCASCNVSQLKVLKQLKKLSLRNVKFLQMHELLRELGKQLIYLYLCHIQNIDLQFIGENCLGLKCFHLFSYGVMQPPLDRYGDNLLPGFQNVSCLKFDCDWNKGWTGYMLSQCTNVKNVDITSHRSDTYLSLKQILMRNPMKRLEKLCWTPSSPEGENIAVQLAYQCSNLVEIKGLCKEKVNYRGVKLLPAK